MILLAVLLVFPLWAGFLRFAIWWTERIEERCK